MNRLPSIRRWGVAALTGVTLFGGLSIVGAGVASAASPTVTAALSTGSAAETISGNATTTVSAGLTLTINGPVVAGDVITLTLGCPSTGSAIFSAPVTVTNTNLNTSAWAPQAIGHDPVTNCSTETLKAAAADTASSSSIALSSIGITTAGVATQTLAITGSYAQLGVAATSFAVPTIANVSYFTVTSNSPAVTLPATGTTAISPITIYDPTEILHGSPVGNATVTDGVPGTGPVISQAQGGNPVSSGSSVPNAAIGDAYSTITFTIAPGSNGNIASVTASNIPTGMTFTPTAGATASDPWTATLSGTPTAATPSTTPVFTVTAIDAGSTPATTTATIPLAVAPAQIVLTLSAGTWSGTPTVTTVGSGFAVTAPGVQSTNTLTLAVTGVTSNSSGQSLTVSNASVVTNGVMPSTVSATVTYGSLVLISKNTVGTVLGTATTIYGANGTADGTVAAEFENAFPAGNNSVVLATDIAHTNGSDALAASYLEGQLGTGLLITTPTMLGADAQAAIQREGVKTVYVVGGPLAITPAVITQIEALPAYNAGGLTLAGGNVKVVGPIYGATAADTASAIANYFGSVYGAGSFAGAYANNVGSTSTGLYNDTAGSASTTAPVGFVPTAIVVASSDWQDSMSIAPEAYKMRFPVILADPSGTTQTLGADATASLKNLGVKQVILVGGQLAVSNTVEASIEALGISVLRIAGIDGTDTAAQIANFALATGTAGLGWSFNSKNTVIASHGDYWSDALGAAALGGGANATFGLEPIILTESPSVIGQYTTAELAVLANDGVTNLTVLGGPLAMPAATVNSLLAGL